jgi:hypothetical protein
VRTALSIFLKLFLCQERVMDTWDSNQQLILKSWLRSFEDFKNSKKNPRGGPGISFVIL